jgi:hypothetical protein
MIPDANVIGNSISPSFTIKNTGETSISLSDVVLEYYTFDPSVIADNLRADIYYCSIGSASGSFSRLSQIYGSDTQKADLQIRFTFTGGTLAPNASMQLQTGIHTADWQYNFNESDDLVHPVQSGTKLHLWLTVTGQQMRSFTELSLPGCNPLHYSGSRSKPPFSEKEAFY